MAIFHRLLKTKTFSSSSLSGIWLKKFEIFALFSDESGSFRVQKKQLVSVQADGSISGCNLSPRVLDLGVVFRAYAYMWRRIKQVMIKLKSH